MFGIPCQDKEMEIGRWGTKLVTRLLAPAALWVRILTSLKNANWAK
jgi:hypothetical protein